jgi:hypothetical protein
MVPRLQHSDNTDLLPPLEAARIRIRRVVTIRGFEYVATGATGKPTRCRKTWCC